MTILIIEGMRGTGKTSLIEVMPKYFERQHFRFPIVVHKRERTENPFESMVEDLTEQWRNPKTLFIWDRCHLTEYVMSTAFERTHPKLLYDRTIQIDEMLRDLNAICCILDAKEDIVSKRLSIRSEESRKADIPYGIAKSLWRTAHGLSSISFVIENNNRRQRAVVLDTIKTELLKVFRR